ncbi:hypothetical protein [Streptomyces sp. NPDC090994]|uniref:hypothetical protein n=1 Tax=Streptomyces sp. NPDC090994 TaxID=3365969 RepID=UPI0037F995F4
MIVTSGLEVAAATASTGSPAFRYEVDPNAYTYKNIPGTEITFGSAAGESSYLRSTGIVASSVDTLESGDNIGNTFAIICQYSDGTALPGSVEAGAYWATNIVPPSEVSITPAIRWVFTAPTTATYTCRLSVTSYSTIIRNGRTVTMQVAAGAQLNRSQYAGSAGWTLSEGQGTIIQRGSDTSVMSFTYEPRGSGRTTIVQDAALSTCKPLSSICDGGTSAYTGTKAETWIEAQPLTAGGEPCGPLIKSAPNTWSISTAKHHQTAMNSLYIDHAQIVECEKIVITMRIRNVDGNPLYVHAGWAINNMAATHGFALTAY